MTEKIYTPNYEPLDNFKRNAELNAPASVDFSEQVMYRIQRESEESINDGARSHKRPVFSFALIALVGMLISGFAYAASEGWLSIKDDSGREVMQVSSTLDQHSEQVQFLDRVHRKVKDQLQLGEAAFILNDQVAIDAIKRHEMPMSYGIVNRGFTYKSMQDISSRLISPLSELKLPGDQVVDAKFMYVEVLSNSGIPVPLDPEKWVEATDAETGSPYAYSKFKPAEDVTLKYDTVRLNYQDEEAIYTLMVNYVKDLDQNVAVKIYDEYPSVKRVYESHGIPIYHSAGDGEPFFIWLQPLEGGSFSYTLMGEGKADKQLKFVKSFIEVNASDSE
ncbi:hypothetical protein [Cohnella mopanensis]|uniref:hypothetical protein n=1 Tax=Cohnella mopanensis TaxID=2911966 RepID=UPI001EF78893|nr:hypothetical protein [Cohnella mopanensis]